MPRDAQGVLVLRKGLPILEQLRTFPGQLIAIGVAVSLFVALGSLAWPFGRDQANFAWVAGVILDGGVPYRDAWDIKGPLSYYASALGLGILGHHAISSRLPDLLAVTVCCGLLRKLVLRVTGGDGFGAHGAVICFVLLYYANGFWSTAQPDGWGGMLILAVTLILLESPQRLRWSLAAAGGLIATAALFKQTFLLFTILPLMTPLLEPVSWRERVKLTSCCLLVLFLTIGASLLVLSYFSRGLQDFTDILRFLRASYVPRRNVHNELVYLEFVLPHLGLLIPLLLAPIGIIIMRRPGMGRQATVIGVWFVLTLLLVFVQGRYWPYHWIPADIAMAALMGVIFARLGHPEGTPISALLRKKIAAPVICLSVLALPGARALLENYAWPLYAVGVETRQQYFAHVTAGWYGTYEKLAAYVIEHSRPSDTVLLWGWDAIVNVLSDRRAPTRFGYSYPLVIPGPLQARYRELFLQEISRAPPRYIIVDAQGEWPLVNKSGLELMKEFSEFDRFVGGHYRLATAAGPFQIWALVN